jgi:PleD family two-component response regulator
MGKGTEFIISFPKGKEHLPADKIFQSISELSASNVPVYLEEIKSWSQENSSISKLKRKGKHSQNDKPLVMIVDDNADMRNYLESILTAYFRIIKAENGKKAFHLMKEISVDLVLTDVMMPEMDGYELMTAIKRHEKFKKIPVIMLSAQASEEHRIEGMKYGADDYLVKPFLSRELITRVDARIQIARLREKADHQR